MPGRDMEMLRFAQGSDDDLCSFHSITLARTSFGRQVLRLPEFRRFAGKGVARWHSLRQHTDGRMITNGRRPMYVSIRTVLESLGGSR